MDTSQFQALFFDMDFTLFPCDSMGIDLFEPVRPLLESWNLETEKINDIITTGLWQGPPPEAIGALDLEPQQKTELLHAYAAVAIPKSSHAYPDVLPFFEALLAKTERPQLILVSRGLHRFQWNKIYHLGFDQIFDYVQVVGDDRHSAFPDKLSAFQHFVNQHNIDPQASAVIGDKFSDELSAGAKLGMTTIQTLRPNVQPSEQADHQIKTLEDLTT